MTQTITFTDINDLNSKLQGITLQKGQRASFHMDVDVKRSTFFFWESGGDIINRLQTNLDIDNAILENGLLIVSKKYVIEREYNESLYHHFVVGMDYTVEGDAGPLVVFVIVATLVIGLLSALSFAIIAVKGSVSIASPPSAVLPSTGIGESLTSILEAGGGILVLAIILLLIWRWKK